MLPLPAASQQFCAFRRLTILVVISALVLAVASQPAQAQNTTVTFWPTSTTPSTPDSGPDSAVELGLKFSARQARLPDYSFTRRQPTLEPIPAIYGRQLARASRV